VFLENLFANFPNFIYDRVLHRSIPQQLFRRANNRASIPGVTACPLQLCQDLGIVDMSAIPCQQVVHPINRGDRHVKRICSRGLRYASKADDRLRQGKRLLINGQQTY
jgi:hypothetical protein